MAAASQRCESAMNATPVSRLQDETTRCFVHHLPGDREELEPNFQSAGAVHRDRQHVEEQGAVVLRFERHQLAACARRAQPVDRAQIGGLSTQCGPVVHELHREFPCAKVHLHCDCRPAHRSRVNPA